MKSNETPPVTLCIVLLRLREEFNIQFVFSQFKKLYSKLGEAKEINHKKY